MDRFKPQQGQTLDGLANRVPASRTTTREARVPTPSMCMHALLGGQNKKGATQRRVREGGVNDRSST